MSQSLPFVTHDTALASALLIKGFKLQSRRYMPDGKAHFIFYGGESLRRVIELYWNDELLLNARTLLGKYKSIIVATNDKLR
ncbi:MAG: DUF5659 domain-containing protein [Patescibacteria group bacterium]